MTDNNDETYSFSYSVTVDGAITVLIKLHNNGVRAQWFANTSFIPPAVKTNTTSNIGITFSWGSNFIPNTWYDFTGVLTAKVKAATRETYTFTFIADDGSQIFFNGSEKVNIFGNACVWADSSVFPLIAGKLYDILINYR